jgi:NAD(P)-dependent dehydrogenase (short-subunit alcohol dehydrogenase family)
MDKEGFADRVVLITGAGSGIGRQLAHVLAGEGAKIAALDRSPEALAALAGELAGKPFASAVADVTDLAATRAAAAELEARLGPTDLLLANAGIGKATSALDFKAEDIGAQIAVNLIGVANSVDAVLPGMRQRRRGHLAVLSSLASYRGLPLMAGYCASKAGVSALFDSLRVELTPLGIAVTTICPGWIRTPLTTNIEVPQPYMMEVDYAVGRMVRALRRRRPYIAFPPRAAWQVRLLRWLPCGLSDWLVRRKFARLMQQKK